jgi:SAM-dependent methyltransferase
MSSQKAIILNPNEQVRARDLMHLIPYSRTFTQLTKDFFAQKQLERVLKKENWVLSSYGFHILFTGLPDWEKHYLPLDIRNKTILDIGAGEGETAFFFLSHGATKVISIERDAHVFKMLKNNALRHPKIIPINKAFTLSDLEIKADFAKIDIEGYEEVLLSLDKMPCPTVLEIHGQQLQDKFAAKGWQVLRGSPYGCSGCGYFGDYGYFGVHWIDPDCKKAR